jgi:hypothetical protein
MPKLTREEAENAFLKTFERAAPHDHGGVLVGGVPVASKIEPPSTLAEGGQARAHGTGKTR